MPGAAGDVQKLKAVFLLHVRVFLTVDLAQKHGKRTKPQAAVAIELAVDNIGLSGLGILCNGLDQIVVALKMAVNTSKLDLTHKKRSFSAVMRRVRQDQSAFHGTNR